VISWRLPTSAARSPKERERSPRTDCGPQRRRIAIRAGLPRRHLAMTPSPPAPPLDIPLDAGIEAGSEVGTDVGTEKWFRILAETSAAAIFVFREDSTLFVNQACVDLTGYTL